MAKIELRPATAWDAASVAEVYLASRQNLMPYVPIAHSNDEVRAWIRDTVVPTGGVIVATVDDHVVGMMALMKRDGVNWIDHLYIHPDAISHGIGSRLLKKALADLEPPIRLYTFQLNYTARAFYERYGFKEIEFGDGSGNEEGVPDVLYEWTGEDK